MKKFENQTKGIDHLDLNTVPQDNGSINNSTFHNIVYILLLASIIIQ